MEGDESREPRLRVHSFASGDTREVAPTEAIGSPLFWSPDGRFVGFSDGRTLKRVDVAEGVVESLGDGFGFTGGSWNEDGVIVFGGRTRIMQVSAGGGTPAPVTTVDEARGEIAHASPRFLPDGRHFIYRRLSSDSDVNGLYVGTLDADPDAQDPTRLIATPRAAAYAPSSAAAGTGHLLFMEDRRLLAQPFDDRRLRLDGSPTVVAEDIGYLGFWGSFSVSRTGAVAWRGDDTAGSVRWFESTGDEWAPGAIRDLYAPRNPRLSPDERRLALVVGGDIWVFDLDGRPPSGSPSTISPTRRRCGHRTEPASSTRRTGGSRGRPPTAPARRSRSAAAALVRRHRGRPFRHPPLGCRPCYLSAPELAGAVPARGRRELARKSSPQEFRVSETPNATARSRGGLRLPPNQPARSPRRSTAQTPGPVPSLKKQERAGRTDQAHRPP